jgi:hypothetical protein
MMPERSRHIARIDKTELAEMPAAWSSRERGHFLRMLLCFRGIDPHALFRVEYYPHRCCWLLLQEQRAEERPAAPFLQADEAFYLQTMTEFRRAARSAFAAASARSLHFASHGCAYQLPPKPQEATTFDLAKQLGGKVAVDSAIHFTAEGGWQRAPSEN